MLRSTEAATNPLHSFFTPYANGTLWRILFTGVFPLFSVEMWPICNVKNHIGMRIAACRRRRKRCLPACRVGNQRRFQEGFLLLDGLGVHSGSAGPSRIAESQTASILGVHEGQGT